MNVDDLTKEELKIALAKKEKEEKSELEKREKEFQQKKETFLKNISDQFSVLSTELKCLKETTINQAKEIHKEMFEILGKVPKDQKTITIKNESFKLVVENQEKFEFTEEAIVHIQSIKDIFKEKFAGRNQGFYKLLESILMKNSKGEFDPKLLAKGRQQVKELGDDQLIQEFTKLEDCQRVYGSSTYCRAYHKNELNKWQDINIQFSSL